MNAEVKATWVADLRSGKYKQGRDYLRTAEGTYCCLGVLCDRSPVGHWASNPTETADHCVPFVTGSDPVAVTHLPDKVVEWAGLTDAKSQKIIDRLIVANDDGDNFNTIADEIEEKL